MIHNALRARNKLPIVSYIITWYYAKQGYMVESHTTHSSLIREHKQSTASDFTDFWICCSLSKNKRHVFFWRKKLFRG